ncbi:poly-gamma-glutamate biosynthesis protein PgsC/CapC, partial [Pyxidicoccus sp. 3LG]
MALLSTLTLFPAYSLDTSILAAVLVGVLILALLTESFGWVFVGLVVPGYLASVFVIHPEAGVTVVVEAMLTYAVALGLSSGLSRTGAWSEFFGRDRFFAIVLSSVLVRAVSEAVLLPHVGLWLDARWGTSFALDRSLHSIGLVLVPLTANAFWKLKLRRGLLQVGVPVLLTYVLLRFVLLPATNLSFSSLELMYEDVAQDFLASPKAYIILLVTALLAARFNLHYGWDFNGILVPALLALTWLEPAKLLATLVEVLLLVLGTQALLATPGLRTLNLEGPRKTVLVFFLGFVVKWAIGWALGGRVPGLKVTDLFGFGYLVPTLLAVKILQKQAVARVMLATVHTSLAGFLVGSLVGFGLSLVEPRPAIALAPEPPHIQAPGLGLDTSPLGVMAHARATARENDASGVPLRRRNHELRQYSALWRAANAWLETADAEGQRRVRERAAALGLELRPLPRETPEAPERFALMERERVDGRRGWDTALLIPGAPGPVLEV